MLYGSRQMRSVISGAVSRAGCRRKSKRRADLLLQVYREWVLFVLPASAKQLRTESGGP